MTNVPLSFISSNNSQKFASLAESLSLAEKECEKFRSNTYQSDIKIDLSQLSTHRHSRIAQKRKNRMVQFRGKDSIFKRPECPPPRANLTRVPDHHKNPHKWTKYSLADVSNEDMSNKTNSQAAYSFLNDLKSRKQLSITEVEEPMELSEPVFKSRNKILSKIEFRKPKNEAGSKEVPLDIPEHNTKPIFTSSKIVMPEYVVGQKQEKKSHKKVKVAEKAVISKHVKLDHLQESEEEES